MRSISTSVYGVEYWVLERPERWYLRVLQGNLWTELIHCSESAGALVLIHCILVLMARLNFRESAQDLASIFMILNGFFLDKAFVQRW